MLHPRGFCAPKEWGRWFVDRRFLRGLLNSEDCPQFFTEDGRSATDGKGEEDHCPNAQGAGDKPTIPEEAHELENSFRDGIKLLFLGENQGVGNFQHGLRKS